MTVSQNLDRWASAVDGKWIDTGNPNVDSYGRPTTPECIDLARDWAMRMGAPEQAYGHAVDFAENLARVKGWASADPRGGFREGDVVSVVHPERWPAPYGHVFTVKAVGASTADGYQAQIVEQNPTPARIRWTTVPRSSIVGIARPVGPLTITVRDGDGWWQTARRAGVSMDALLKANGATTATVIHPGQVLKVPA